MRFSIECVTGRPSGLGVRSPLPIPDSLQSYWLISPLKYFLELRRRYYRACSQRHRHVRREACRFREKFSFFHRSLTRDRTLSCVHRDKNFPTIRTNIANGKYFVGGVAFHATSNAIWRDLPEISDRQKIGQNWSMTVASISFGFTRSSRVADRFDVASRAIILPAHCTYGILGLKWISRCASFVGIKGMSRY